MSWPKCAEAKGQERQRKKRTVKSENKTSGEERSLVQRPSARRHTAKARIGSSSKQASTSSIVGWLTKASCGIGGCAEALRTPRISRQFPCRPTTLHPGGIKVNCRLTTSIIRARPETAKAGTLLIVVRRAETTAPETTKGRHVHRQLTRVMCGCFCASRALLLPLIQALMWDVEYRGRMCSRKVVR